MLCGFASIYFCMRALVNKAIAVPDSAKVTLNNPLIEELLPSFLAVAGFFIFLGMFFDMLDGRVARMTSGTSTFGGQLDSLADVISFGAAPAMLVIALVLIAHGQYPIASVVASRMAWAAGGLYLCCTALRLARFNVENSEELPRHMSFRGLPSPGAAAVIATLVILYEHVQEVRGNILVNVLPFVALAAGLLMVSNVRYVHVTNTYFRGRRPFSHVVTLVILATFVIRWPAPTAAALAGLYALSGPVGAIYRWFRPSARQALVEAAPGSIPASEEQA
jgi:CDP-diacylglycerol--serine O-phosphatidyltransferase